MKAFFSVTRKMIPRYKKALSEPIDFTSIETGSDQYFEVSGSTGNLYRVSINRETASECNCADYRNRKRMCKHIMCVLIKEYLLNIDQIRELEQNPHLGLNDVPINTSLCGDACDCPVCFQQIDQVEWQCQQCKKVFHMACISDWFNILQRQRMELSCPTCRHVITQ